MTIKEFMKIFGVEEPPSCGDFEMHFLLEQDFILYDAPVITVTIIPEEHKVLLESDD